MTGKLPSFFKETVVEVILNLCLTVYLTWRNYYQGCFYILHDPKKANSSQVSTFTVLYDQNKIVPRPKVEDRTQM